MANYYATTRTNYFRVTDEKRYSELFGGLCAEDNIEDFTQKDENGVIWHGFGCYGSIDYMPDEDEDEDLEYDFDSFINELQKILPDDEAFIFMESGYEKLRYVTGFVLVATKEKCETMEIQSWALEAAKRLLGNENFNSQLDY